MYVRCMTGVPESRSKTHNPTVRPPDGVTRVTSIVTAVSLGSFVDVPFFFFHFPEV